MNPFTSGTRLRDMIRSIRACKTAAEERAVVRKECAAIRASISENDQDYRHRNLAKLMFIHMLGYPTHFGQMECLKLIASSGFPEKRIGYLGLMLLLDERQEVLMLVTNSLKQDLNHSNQYIAGLALCALGNICSAEMARDLSPEVEKLLQNSNPNIRKKAALCSIRIIRKAPDLAENFMKPAGVLLGEKHHGVLITGVQLCTEICKASTEALDYLKKYTKDLVRVMKNVVASGYAPEYDISGITDPFLQIRVMRLLRVLGQGDADASDAMSDILAQVATSTESNKNAGNAILYECVETIMGIEAIGGLRVLAINILGRFLSNRDNNIRYVALNMLMKAVTMDTQAVQRHRNTIVECVKDSDASIRKRALELVFLLVNDNNVKQLTKELIDYLEVSDPEFKDDLTAKICSIVEKFSPDKLWYIDQMLKVLSEAGNYVKDEVWHALIVVISNAQELHGYTVRAFYKALQASTNQESLVRVGVWCIGEYGEMLVNHAGKFQGEAPITVTKFDVVDMLDNVLKRSISDVTTNAMTLIALLKLCARFPSCSLRIEEIVVQQKRNLVLELQQRSIEFSSIIHKHQNIKSTLLEKMPVLDEAVFSGKRKGSSVASPLDTVSKAASSVASLDLSNGLSKPPAAPLVDLLDLDSDVALAPSEPARDFLSDLLGVDLSSSSLSSGVNQTEKSGADILLDLLSIGTVTPDNNSSTENHEGIMPNIREATSPLSSLSVPAKPQGPGTAQEPILDMKSQTSPMHNLLDDFIPSKPVNAQPSFQSIVVFQSASLKVQFSFSKQSDKPSTTSILATFTNSSSSTYTDFIFQAAVPKFIQLRLDPASSNVLPAAESGSITQHLSVTNSLHRQKPLAMRIRIAYRVNNQDMLEQGQINNFPPGL
ncbi:unnamed protein product [Victoria cruziana]